MLRLKLQYFGHMMQRTDSLEKDSDAGKHWRQEEKGMTENEMVGWHHRLDGHEFEQAPGVGDGHGSLACCSPWSHKELDMTERLNWTELNWRTTHLSLLSLCTVTRELTCTTRVQDITKHSSPIKTFFFNKSHLTVNKRGYLVPSARASTFHYLFVSIFFFLTYVVQHFVCVC